jgi:hypothetical protein
MSVQSDPTTQTDAARNQASQAALRYAPDPSTRAPLRKKLREANQMARSILKQLKKDQSERRNYQCNKSEEFKYIMLR